LRTELTDGERKEFFTVAPPFPKRLRTPPITAEHHVASDREPLGSNPLTCADAADEDVEREDEAHLLLVRARGDVSVDVAKSDARSGTDADGLHV
jgi:hypothetical protein